VRVPVRAPRARRPAERRTRGSRPGAAPVRPRAECGRRTRGIRPCRGARGGRSRGDSPPSGEGRPRSGSPPRSRVPRPRVGPAPDGRGWAGRRARAASRAGSRPVAAACGHAAFELGEGHRPGVLPGPVRVAVVGDPGGALHPAPVKTRGRRCRARNSPSVDAASVILSRVHDRFVGEAAIVWRP
jgi:hypothetical protein